jgi:uncharacterized protein
MDLSELDGFMAGIIAGPLPLPPTDWLPIVWDHDDPAFRDPEEAEQLMMTIGARYHEILDTLDAATPDYNPVFWEDIGGTTITEDWAAGFMQAVALHPKAWNPILAQDATASLLIPIAAVAGLALPVEAGGDLAIPDGLLDRMLDDAETLLPNCVVGLRLFWRGKGVRPARFPAGRRH